MEGKLYIVATPIGNLADMSFRAVEILKSVDRVIAEDTRTTGNLLKHYGIEAKLQAIHQHNEHHKLAGLLDDLRAGAKIAQVSDAGTPGISDPGFLLARACMDAGIPVEVIPGAVAFIPALLKSGFALHRFVFEGFLPLKKGRQTRLLEILAEPRTTVLYESPHKILKTLQQLRDLGSGSRRCSVSRELTKMFEETVNGTLDQAIAHFEKQAPRGEFVLVLEGTDTKSEAESSNE